MQISHREACNLVRAEALVYQLSPADRVLQGFSTSFDASVEEIWMAFYAGATLVVGTKELMLSGPDLPAKLESMKVVPDGREKAELQLPGGGGGGGGAMATPQEGGGDGTRDGGSIDWDC